MPLPLTAHRVVYSDGACSKTGFGGWAWAVQDGLSASGAVSGTTNQRMELHAVLEAVTNLPGPLTVVSDSAYVVNAFVDAWWEKWQRNGWRNAKGDPVANRDLWEPLIAAVEPDSGRVRFRHIRGHCGDPMNDLVDRLAVQARRDHEAASQPIPLRNFD